MENPIPTSPFGDEVSDETKTIARNLALKLGLYLGVIGIIMLLAVYLIYPLLWVKLPVMGSLLLLITLGLDIYFCIELRKSVGGFWNFKLAFSSIFIMLLVGAWITHIFTIILYKIIDKDLPQKMMDASFEKIRGDLAAKGITGDQLESQMAMAKKFVPDQGSMSVLLLGFLAGLIFCIILGLILAAIFKKEKPIFSASA